MKTLQVLHLLLLLSSLCFIACGGAEDRNTHPTYPFAPTDTADEIAEDTDFMEDFQEAYAQLNAKEIRVPFNWEKVEDPVLRAAYARYMLSSGQIDIPLNWAHTEDLILLNEYYRARLIITFRDIPEVHIVANANLQYLIASIKQIPWITLKPGEHIAYLEAIYHLWPSENNRITLESARRDEEAPTYEELMEQNPVLWAEREREQLLEEHGDKPQIHIMADFKRKLALELPTTDEEYLVYLQAVADLHPEDETAQRLLERFSEAKADGIPFEDVKVDDILQAQAAGNP